MGTILAGPVLAVNWLQLGGKLAGSWHRGFNLGRKLGKSWLQAGNNSNSKLGVNWLAPAGKLA